jgi:Ca2+-binding EF-hand superfamily protein
MIERLQILLRDRIRGLTNAPGIGGRARCTRIRRRVAVKRLDSRLDDIEELYDRTDEDGDDQISLTEFRGLMLDLDRHMQDSAVASSFREIDTNRDGQISFAEFRSWWLSD